MEEMTRSSKVIFTYSLMNCDMTIEAVITRSSGDYWYGPEVDTLNIYERTDAYETVLYTEQKVDEDFDFEEVKQKVNDLADLTYVSNETKEPFLPF